jgi:hypothetical protein
MQRALATLAWTILLGGALFLLFFAPWHQLHPVDRSLVVATFRAPLWQHAYPDDRLDWSELVIEITAMGIISGLLFVVAGLRRRG